MERYGGAQGILRVEDQRLLTGAGRFTDDLRQDGAAWLVVLRSPHAHARIVRLNSDAARAMPGVLAVFSGADLLADGVGALGVPALFKRPDGSPMSAPPRYALEPSVARYVGHGVAAVVAETRAQAQDAAEAIEVEYEPLPAVTGARDAVAEGAPLVWPDAPGNVAAHIRHGDPAAVEAAFARAAHVVRRELVNNRLVANALEPRAALCLYDAARAHYTLHVGSQNPTALRQMLAESILKVPLESVRVVVGDIGGGFGMKSHLSPEDALVCYAAGKLRRPVRWRADRTEEFLIATQGRDNVSRAELALDSDGRALALRVETLANLGATLAPSSAVVPLMLGPKILTGVYDIPAIDVTVAGVLTNTATVAPYRGAGRPEAIYLIERMMDAAAAELGLDPVAMRRRNLVPRAAMPYRNAMGETYDSGDFAHFLDSACRRADWDGFPARREESRARGRLRGRGLSTYIEWTGAYQFTEKVEVIVSGDGRVTVYSATQAMGQGLETSYIQLVADRLGIDPACISVLQGDTDKVQGFGSMGSRSLYVGGSAVDQGAKDTIAAGTRLAADALEAAEADIAYRDGWFEIAGTDRAIGLFELAARQPGGTIAVETVNKVEGSSWPNGCHVCEVEIDPETGQVELVRYATVDDVGRAVHPAIVHGQIQGGIAQGAGQALLEQTVYDPQSGQLLTGSFMDYGMPRADTFPSIDNSIDQSVPCLTNPLGAKGAGESGTVAATPAVMNAILDALRPLGVTHLDMPATPYAVWRAIREAGEERRTAVAAAGGA